MNEPMRRTFCNAAAAMRVHAACVVPSGVRPASAVWHG